MNTFIQVIHTFSLTMLPLLAAWIHLIAASNIDSIHSNADGTNQAVVIVKVGLRGTPLHPHEHLN